MSFDCSKVNAPEPVRKELESLSGNIRFDRQSEKGGNGYLFFGENIILNRTVAVKFYDWQDDPRTHDEPKHLCEIKAENVIQIFDARIVDKSSFAYFITPYCSGGDLDDQIVKGTKGPIWAIELTRQVLKGLSYLHAKSLLHRDLKPQNLLVDSSEKVLIGDFGSVKRIPGGHTNVNGSGHSIIYRPPESVISKTYQMSSDLYQVGIILYQLLGGRFSYLDTDWLKPVEILEYDALGAGDERQIFVDSCICERITKGQILDFKTLPAFINRDLRSIIRKCSNTDPNRRFETCSELLVQLSKIREKTANWSFQNGSMYCSGRKEFKVTKNKWTGAFKVEKLTRAGWRQDHRLTSTNINTVITEIERQI